MSNFPHDRAAQYLKANEDYERVLEKVRALRDAVEQSDDASQRRKLLVELQELELAKAKAWLALEGTIRRLRSSVRDRALFKIKSFRFPEQTAVQVADIVCEKVVGMVVGGEFANVRGVTSYTDKTARHRALDVKNSATNRRIRLGKDGDEVYADVKSSSQAGPLAYVHTVEEVASMEDLVARLRPAYRLVIEALYLEGKDLADVVASEARKALRVATAELQGGLLTRKQARDIVRKTRSNLEKFHQRALRQLAWERMRQLRHRCPGPLRPAIDCLLGHGHTDSNKKIAADLTAQLFWAAIDASELERADDRYPPEALLAANGWLAVPEEEARQEALAAFTADGWWLVAREEQAHQEALAMIDGVWRWLYASTTVTELLRAG